MARFDTLILHLTAVITGSGVMKIVKGADVYWRDFYGTIPSDALPTQNGLYIAQVYDKVVPSHIPATYYPNTKTAIGVIQGRKIEFSSHFKILCTKEPERFRWKTVEVDLLDTVMHKCIKGGYEDSNDLYIGKAFHENEWKIGKVFDSSPYKGLHLWSNDPEHVEDVLTKFEILMVD